MTLRSWWPCIWKRGEIVKESFEANTLTCHHPSSLSTHQHSVKVCGAQITRACAVCSALSSRRLQTLGPRCSSDSVFCNVCVWRYSGIASLLARQRSCAAVKLQCSAALSGCTALVATSTVFATCGRSCRFSAPGEPRFSAH